MERTFAIVTMLVAGILTVSLPNEALAELTFDQWATAEGYTPPGPVDWACYASNKGITSADGVNSYTNLLWLKLGGNQISSLDADQFHGLTNLGVLQLSGNDISRLDANQFQGLTNLSSLDLGYNSISSLAADQFRDLSNLGRLSLTYNSIPRLDAEQFQGMTNLQTLWLSNNRISSLSANQFQGLTKLQSLWLNDNDISSLSTDQFQGMTNLETLYLDSNHILSLDADQFQGMTKLQDLSLFDNQLSSLSANQFQGMTDLWRLTLSHNQLSSLNANQFRGLTSLRVLELKSNQLSSLDLTGFEATELIRFRIRWNPITEVILTDTTLSQTTFDTLMIGNSVPSNDIGIAELAGIASVDFTAADMAGVVHFDRMFAMADLQTLTLTDVLFSDTIVADGYAEVWDLISALDANRLDALTVDEQLYAAMQTNLDTWDAGPNNVLTVVPEPSTLALLAIAGLALLLWRKRATSR